MEAPSHVMRLGDSLAEGGDWKEFLHTCLTPIPPIKSMHFIDLGRRGLLVSSWPHSSEEAFSWMQTVPYAEWGGAYPARSLHKARGQCLWSQQQWFHSVLFQWGLWKAGHLYVRWFAAEFCVCSTPDMMSFRVHQESVIFPANWKQILVRVRYWFTLNSEA